MHVWKVLGLVALVGCGGVSTGRGGSSKGDSNDPQPPGAGASGGTGTGNGATNHSGGGGMGGYVGGSGGAGGLVPGGSAGSSTELACFEPYDNDCSSPPIGDLAVWRDRDIDVDATPALQLKEAQATVLGSWHGVVTTPWVEPYFIAFTFEADGTYSAHCDAQSDYDGGGGCCRALYYGSDRDSPLKRWRLTDVKANGSATGDLQFLECFRDSCTADGQPVWICPEGWQGRIDELSYDVSGDRLRFELWNMEYGPLKIDLERD